VHFTIYMYLYLYSYRRETARQLRMCAQLTRCFSAVAELLVAFVMFRFDIREQQSIQVLRLEENQFRCTWNFTAIERHGDIAHGCFFRHKGRVELRVTELCHVTRNMSIVNDNLNAAAARLARVDCAQNTTV